MMRWFNLIKVFLFAIVFILTKRSSAQNIIVDSSADNSSLRTAVNLYHQFLSPETGLYNGSEYTYNVYYPFTINEGDPFFISKQFDTGAVFYNNVLYKKVPLLYDIVKGELCTKDPTSTYIVRLNNTRIKWFNIFGHTFIKLKTDSTVKAISNQEFFDLLYNGNTALLKRLSKIIKENSASSQGINKYIAEVNEYFIMKDKQYYQVKNKKSLLSVMADKKKEIDQFIRKNRLNLKRDKDHSLIKIVAYYDELNNNNIKRN
jgi:hypothetical protein